MHQQERRHSRSLLELPVVIQEQEKFVPFFQLPNPPSFSGSPATSGCGKKGVSRLETQAAYEERQEEPEQIAPPEARRVGEYNSHRSIAKKRVNAI